MPACKTVSRHRTCTTCPTISRPGVHRLTLRIDNRSKYPVGDVSFTSEPYAHAYTEETQTRWNGVIGRMRLQAFDPVWVKSVQVYPDVKAKSVRLRVTVGNATGKAAKAEAVISAKAVRAKTTESLGSRNVTHVTLDVPVGGTTAEWEHRMGASTRPWDEFDPALYDLTVQLSTRAGEASMSDRKTVRFGLREVATDHVHILINGRPRFLRGTLECCIFPRLGAPVDGRSVVAADVRDCQVA